MRSMVWNAGALPTVSFVATWIYVARCHHRSHASNGVQTGPCTTTSAAVGGAKRWRATSGLRLPRSTTRTRHVSIGVDRVRGGEMHRPDGTRLLLEAGHVCMVPAGVPIDLRAHQPWHFWWWTIDGTDVAQMLASLQWSDNAVRSPGPPPVALFEQLIGLIAKPGHAAQAAALAYRLMLQAHADEAADDDDLVTCCAALIADNAEHSWCDVAWLAGQLDCHRSTLSRRCTHAWGYGPADALRACRRDRGIELLLTTAAPVAEIAAAAGFSDAAYFSREIRRVSGMSPRQLRRS